jgi:hypothetical protein
MLRRLTLCGAIAQDRGKSAEACDFYRRSLALYEGMGADASQNAGIVRKTSRNAARAEARPFSRTREKG